MSKRKDFIPLSKNKFGHLKVIKMADTKIKQSGCRTMYECQCDCGNFTFADSWALEHNHKTRCERCSGALNKQPVTPFNRARQRNNTSGYPGVDFHCGKWRARIYFHNKHIHIGIFDTIDVASAARLAYELKIKKGQ